MSRKPHGIACPHCGHGMRTRNSRPITNLCRELDLQCGNTDCGATYNAQLGIMHMISPSATPNPAVSLRVAPRRRYAVNDDLPRPANDDNAAPANDNRGPEVPPAADDLPSSAVG